MSALTPHLVALAFSKKCCTHLSALLRHSAQGWDEAEVVLPGSSRVEEEVGREAGSGAFAARQSTRAALVVRSARQIGQLGVVRASCEF